MSIVDNKASCYGHYHTQIGFALLLYSLCIAPALLGDCIWIVFRFPFVRTEF